MNNKSTENLIESCESIEELHVPPLDLEQLNHGEKNKSDHSNNQNSDTDRSLNNTKPRRIPNNNFLIEKSESKSSTSIPPIPAARKLSLPPIAAQRNGKDTKENSNQQTRNQSVQGNDTIRIISERPNPKPNTKANSNESGSDPDLCQSKQSQREKVNDAIELKTFAANAKSHLKSAFGGTEINEETTSFISYEEKHEKEDNSEHLISNRSSVNSKDLQKYDEADDNGPGVRNEAFVPDAKDNVKSDRASELDGKSKSKKKDKTPKIVKKPKREKQKKRSTHRADETAEQVEIAESDDDVQQTYDFKRVIGNQEFTSRRFTM